jgi:hypothetical protein
MLHKLGRGVNRKSVLFLGTLIFSPLVLVNEMRRKEERKEGGRRVRGGHQG